MKKEARYYDDFVYPTPDEKGFPGEEYTPAEAIGNVTIYFADLEEQLSRGIHFLIGVAEEASRAITSELSFKNKVNLFASLFRQRRPASEWMRQLGDLVVVCYRAEEIRNQVVHSLWITTLADDTSLNKLITRRKHTAKSHGLRTHEETLTPYQIQAIASYCSYVAWSVDQLLYYEFGSEYGEP